MGDKVYYVTMFKDLFDCSSVSLTSTTGKNEELAEDRHKVFNQYLKDTKLLQVLNSWVALIGGLEELPYNPYPTLVWYARRHAER